jgi:glycosyltransferase involved in cell wall biosynthesis
LNQTLLPSELIIIDDSTDKEIQKINAKFCESLPNCTYVYNEVNAGIARNRNKIIELSSFPIIALLDDDDLWCDRNKMDLQIKLLKSSGHQLICSPAIFSNSDTTIYPDRLPHDLLSVLMTRNGVIHTSSVVFQRDFSKLVGAYDENLHRGVDSDLFRRMLINDQNAIGICTDTYIFYRVSSGDNITHRKGGREAWKILTLNLYVIFKYKAIFVRRPHLLIMRLLNTARTIKKCLKN